MDQTGKTDGYFGNWEHRAAIIPDFSKLTGKKGKKKWRKPVMSKR